MFFVFFFSPHVAAFRTAATQARRNTSLANNLGVNEVISSPFAPAITWSLHTKIEVLH